MSLLALARAHYDRTFTSAQGGEREFRESALQRAEATGLPSRRTETWKYSALNDLEKINWPISQAGRELSPVWMEWLEKWRKEFNVVVLAEDGYRADLSKMDSDLHVDVLDVASCGFSGEDGFADLNAAIARPGIELRVGPNVRVARPLLLLRMAGQGWAPTMSSIKIADGAELKVAEVLTGRDESYLRADLNSMTVGERARLNWLRVQGDSRMAFHFNETQARIAAGGALHFTQVNRGSKWLRGQLRVEILGEEASAHVHGLTLADGDQHTDQRVVVSHRAARTSSEQLFKGVYKDKARGITNGKIFIAKDAQKVESRQLNHNLLLSPGAEADSKPELEIYADDVKANHGATVGRLDDEKMFYLTTRGLQPSEAEGLLSTAFAAEIFMKVQDARLRRLAEVNDAPRA